MLASQGPCPGRSSTQDSCLRVSRICRHVSMRTRANREGFKMSVRFAPRLLSDSRARAIPGRAGPRNLPRDGSGLGSRRGRPGAWEDLRMFLSFAYLAFSAVLKLLVGRRRNEFAKDVELLVLRHQLLVLGRQAARPLVRPA